jgi:hypothetical protein
MTKASHAPLYMTAMDMSHHWSIGKRARAVLPLFEEANN